MNPTASLIEPEVRELLETKQFEQLRAVLAEIPVADSADVLSALSDHEAALAFRILPKETAAEVFAYLAPEKQEELIVEMGAKGAMRLLESMAADDLARLVDELPAEVAQRILASLPPEERRETQAILGYPPQSVGRLMTPDYVRLRSDWTIARALEHVRRHGRDAETVNVVYVVDEAGRLIDDVRLRQLLFAEPDQTVEGLMTGQFVALRADQDQEEAVRLMAKHDRIALPVCDSAGILVGIVTHDDVADVAEQEATEDIQKLGGAEALESAYMSAGVREMFQKRSGWLCILFLGQLLTATVIESFESRLERAVFLLALMPLIISSGGNSGSQSASLVIRALALGEVGARDWVRIVRRELIVGLALGIALGALGAARILAWHALGWYDYGSHHALVAAAVGITLVGLVTWATVAGAAFPMILKWLGLDPATSSTPFIATLMDVSGLVIYFYVALFVLRGSVL